MHRVSGLPWRGAGRLAAALLLSLVVSIGTAEAAPPYSYVDQWGTSGSGVGQFDGPYGIAVGPVGDVYVVDVFNNRIQVFDATGVFVSQWGQSGTANGQFNWPSGIGIDRHGNVYVADTWNHRIQKFTANGTFLTKWGTFGSGAGQFNLPVSIAIDPENNVYVADSWNDRIQKFLDTGTFIAQYGTSGSGDGEFFTPAGIEVDRAFDVYVSEINNHRIQVLQDRGNWFAYARKWGSLGSLPGYFYGPKGVALDPDDKLFVVDSQNARVQKFEASGEYLTQWGSAGTGAGQFDSPNSIACGPARDIYVSDSANDRVQKFFSPVPTAHTRVAGNDRYLTAVAASKEAFPVRTRYAKAIIATGENWPDALGGSSLAGAFDAPLLLTTTNSLPAAVRAELMRLKVNSVILLGGEDVVSKAVADQIAALPDVQEVERIAGANRYQTADAIAERVCQWLGPDYDGGAFVATGQNFPDALAASPIAASRGWPIYLAPPNGLTGSTRTSMGNAGVSDVYLLGESDVVSAEIETELEARFGSVHVDRFGGHDRYDTALAVAAFATERAGLGWSHTALCTGSNFPDGLTGGVLAGYMDSVLLLTQGRELEAKVRTTILANKPEVYEVYYLGGTDVVSGAVQNSLESALY